jgi:hypothetical protein
MLTNVNQIIFYSPRYTGRPYLKQFPFLVHTGNMAFQNSRRIGCWLDRYDGWEFMCGTYPDRVTRRSSIWNHVYHNNVVLLLCLVLSCCSTLWYLYIFFLNFHSELWIIDVHWQMNFENPWQCTGIYTSYTSRAKTQSSRYWWTPHGKNVYNFAITNRDDARSYGK